MLDVYEKALQRSREIVANVKPAQYDDKTPCTDYNVKGVMNHLIGGLFMFARATGGEATDPGTPRPDFSDDPVAAFDQGAKLAIEGFAQPGVMEKTVSIVAGDVPGSRALAIALMEAVVHTWDLARGTGQDGTIDPGIATVFLENFAKRPIAQEMRDAGVFGAEVTVPATASPSDRLVAYLGRTP